MLVHDYGWTDLAKNTHRVNNWDIWINGNILKSAMFTLNDISLFNHVLNKTLYSATFILY